MHLHIRDITLLSFTYLERNKVKDTYFLYLIHLERKVKDSHFLYSIDYKFNED